AAGVAQLRRTRPTHENGPNPSRDREGAVPGHAEIGALRDRGPLPHGRGSDSALPFLLGWLLGAVLAGWAQDKFFRYPWPAALPRARPPPRGCAPPPEGAGKGLPRGCAPAGIRYR